MTCTKIPAPLDTDEPLMQVHAIHSRSGNPFFGEVETFGVKDDLTTHIHFYTTDITVARQWCKDLRAKLPKTITTYSLDDPPEAFSCPICDNLVYHGHTAEEWKAHDERLC